MPIVWLLEDSDLEGVGLEAGVEHINEEVTNFVRINIVRERFIVGLGTGGVGDLLLMFIVFVHEDAWWSKDINLLKVKGNRSNGHLFVLSEAVLSVNSGFDFKGVRCAVKVAFGDFQLQLRNHRGTATVERVSAAWCAPLGIGPC